MKYARIEKEKVVEVFETDGDISDMFHPDFIWTEVTNTSPRPAEGWSAIMSDADWKFSAPVVAPPTTDELKSAAIAQRDALLSAANEATAGMADAFIADLLSTSDIAMFKAFAAYKLTLNKIDKQSGFPQEIAWPAYP